ncbi:hypothetical protein CHGG_01532 [Chaetomium globosum CBS 148.51]|uniref:Major facilitator superfamily (MFS) profile domain-containing protein n=1 Tax=Chaetomium globosum (strain ATCC 6205 / CBS 148.51 / DSM 1962 / NBRC 6347 / NRRL 1970) TaxID=306901 RepID=Q2HE22_CHAGB|nr:uncharacterized protein CHGG_01532 [Chaetomium globosum CBS 148.51]EAQ93297.1 hypothetical protein CHGG_01532 [Chaetomium globosum CBS 148.51]
MDEKDTNNPPHALPPEPIINHDTSSDTDAPPPPSTTTTPATVTIITGTTPRTLHGARWFLVCVAIFSANLLYGLDTTIVADLQGRGLGNLRQRDPARVAGATLNLSTLLTSPKEQPFYVGLTGFVYGSGCVLGPVVGGALADSAATWRWAFYLNLCIFAAAAPVYIFLIPSLPRRPSPSFTSNLKSMDWLGTLLTAGLCSAFTVAFSFGGVLWAYSDGRTIALIVVWVTCTLAFGITQKYSILTTPLDRLFPGEFLRDPQLILLYIIMSQPCALLPFICLYVATILACGAVMGRTGYHAAWFLLSGLCLTAGAACMYAVRAHTPLAHIHGFGALLGLGMATSQAGYAVGNQLVRPARAAELIQFLNVSQAASQLIGLAIASAVFQTQAVGGMRAVLGPLGFGEKEIQTAVAGARSDVLQRVGPEVRAQCIDIIVHAISQCWLLVVAAGAVYTLCSLFLTRSRWIVRKSDEDGVVVGESSGGSREGLKRA